MRSTAKVALTSLLGALMLAVVSCGSKDSGSGAAGVAVSSVSTRKSEPSISGTPNPDLQKRYGISVPKSATNASFGHLQVEGGGDLWVSFKTGKDDLDIFLSGLGIDEEDMTPGVAAFTSRDLEMTGWFIDPMHPVKGIMSPAKEGDMKSPSHKVTVDYADPGSMTVYILAGKP
ncbi:hypothetical protein [Kitasatospora sp. A2-31]|uniref:hypothetical protein n=1 Tax=Kitasatospora sp. A2-31 TaxID=2916414 RepID=UPI001EED2D41|nr:hypothetical protein [Kitasatospora sp. A2-31]MCG6499639.1 hypothetical protein [Kitasatospora sp. A2-31]